MLGKWKMRVSAADGALSRHLRQTARLQASRSSRPVFEPLEGRLLLDAAPLVISEFLASNNHILADEDGDYSDWIEVHNASDDPINLDGWFLSDNRDDLRKWGFPAVTLDAGGFLVVFASNKDRTDPNAELHTNFKLSGSGEYLGLIYPDGTTAVHEFAPEYPEQLADLSYGLVEDSTTLVAEGDLLTYFVPTAAEAPLAADWTAVDYDDSAWTGSGDTPPVLITEVGTGRTDWLEIQNLAESTIDTAGWALAVNNANDGINAVHEVLWNLPGAMLPQEVLSRTDDVDSENYYGENIFWRTTGSGWVVVVDDHGDVADFVIWGYDEATFDTFDVTVNGHQITRATLTEAWSGPSAAKNTDSGFTLQRSGSSDRDSAADFLFGPDGSEGEQNGALVPPFPLGKATGIGFDTSMTGFDGAIRTDVQGEMHGVNASLWTRIPFEIEDTDNLDTMKLRMKYNDGFVAYLNGQEIARRNAPDSLQWDSAAQSDRPRADATVAEQIDVSDHVGLLQPGSNVLAIHGLNDGVADGEFLILPEIVAKSDELAIRYMSAPTPGAHNVMTMGGATPVFSHPGGIFTDPFVLELTTDVPSPDAVIRYTLDGSLPTVESTEYVAPLNIDTSTRIRARVFEDDLLPGPLASEGYIALDASTADFSTDLPLIVVETFINRSSQLGSSKLTPAYSVFIDSTESETGRTHITDEPEFVGRSGIRRRGQSSQGWTKGQFAFETWEEGNSDNKDIYSRDAQDLDVSLFGLPAESDWVIQGPFSDKSLLRNYLSYTWSNKMGLYAPRTVLSEVFLDKSGGAVSYPQDYVGVYVFMEKIKIGPDRVDITRLAPSDNSYPEVTGGYVWKKDKAGAGDRPWTTSRGQQLRHVEPKAWLSTSDRYVDGYITPEQDTYLKGYINQFEAALYGPNFDDPENGYAKYLDVDSFIDNWIMVEMTKNIDGFRLSTYYNKDRLGKINMGPVWDYNLSLGNANYLAGGSPSGWYYGGISSAQYPYWDRLFEDPDFRQRLIDRWGEVRQDVFSTEELLDDIDVAAAQIREGQQRNYDRYPGHLTTYFWPNYHVPTSWQNEIDWMTDWLAQRVAWIDSQVLTPPVLDHQGGAIEDPQELTFSAPGGTVYYTLDGTDPRLPGGGISPAASTFDVSTTTYTDLIAVDDLWTYHDDYVDIGTEWREPPYDDSSWKTGKGVFYHGNTSLPAPTNTELDVDSTAYYFRKHVNFNADPQDVLLELRTLVDDGIILYINGEEFLRMGMDEGDVNYRTRAVRSVGSAGYEGPFEIPAEILLQGDNVFAVEVHNRRRTDGDLAFGLQLTAISDTVVTPIVVGNSTMVTARVHDAEFSGRSPGGGHTAPATYWSPLLEVPFYTNAPASSDNLVITELNYNPYDPTPAELAVSASFRADDFEFVEMMNLGGEIIDLGEVEMIEGVAVDLDVVTLAPGERAVVVNNLAAFEARYGTEILVAGEYDGRLNNGGELLSLADRFVEPILDFEYNDSRRWPGRADGKGASLELINQIDPGNRTSHLENPESWRSSGEFGGSPGTAGTGPIDSVVINEVLTHSDPPLSDAIELHNTSDQPVDVGGWYLSDSWGWDWNQENGDYTKFRIPQGTTIEAHGFVVFEESDFNPSGGLDPQNHPDEFVLDGSGDDAGAHGGDVWLMVGDAQGHPTHFVDHVEYEAAAAGESYGRWLDATGSLYPMSGLTLGEANSGPRIGPVIISEVMYHPADAGDDPATYEYVEIYNPTDEAVDLTHWRLTKGIEYSFDEGTLLPSQETILVLSYDLDLSNNAAKVADFRAYYELDDSVHLVGGYLGRLSNGGERVQLHRPDAPPASEPNFHPGLLEDEINYDDQGDWPREADGDGDALHRRGTDQWGNDVASWASAAPTPGVFGFSESSAVVGRYVFYNNSAFDQDASGLTDDDAIAPDKQALLPGQKATLANYTNYVRGINGVMVDVDGLGAAAELSADDFEFLVGNSNDPSGWSAAPAPQSVAVRSGAGSNGSDRVTIVWADGAIARQWLQVTVKATANTALAEDDVFYFGNAIGEAGNSPLNAIVNTTDEVAARNFQHGPTNLAAIDDPFDYDRDRFVDAVDRTIARENRTGPIDTLRLIAAPAREDVLAQAMQAGLENLEPLAADLEWLDAFAQTNTQPARKEGSSAEAVDQLLAGLWP